MEIILFIIKFFVGLPLFLAFISAGTLALDWIGGVIAWNLSRLF